MNHVTHVLNSGTEYVYVLGNHDMYKPNDSKYHALLPFKNQIPRFHVIDSPTDAFNLTFVPYTHDPAKFPQKTLDICICHQTFLGADYGALLSKDGVDPNAVSAKLIISGHIHKRQTIGEKVVYPGSPFSQSANDIDEIKGISVLDTETLEIDFIRCPLPTWRSLTYSVSDSFSVDHLHSALQSSLNEKDHWFVDVSGPKPEISSYLDSKRAKKLIEGKNVKVRATYTESSKKQVKISSTSIETIVIEYLDKVYSGSIDRKILKERALQVFKNVRAFKTATDGIIN
jgi:DNA repair exonuclease SbcCD nuclease subunit